MIKSKPTLTGLHDPWSLQVEGGVEDKNVSFKLTPAKGGVTPGFTPHRALLANGETRMRLLTPDNRQQLHEVNLDRGQIVSTWKFNKDGVDIDIDDIANDNKTAQLENRSTFMGLAANRLVRWDMRTAGGVVQDSPLLTYQGGKDYSRGTNFTCMATSGDGYVAVGSKVRGPIVLPATKSAAPRFIPTALRDVGVPLDLYEYYLSCSMHPESTICTPSFVAPDPNHL